MSMLCKIGVHSWVGCKCARCGKRRNQNHDWNGCKCARCGIMRDQDHCWKSCKCTICGTIRDQDHNWNGCKCARCGKTRDQDHFGNICECGRCGMRRNEENLVHDWYFRGFTAMSDDDEINDKVYLECYRCRKTILVRDPEKFGVHQPSRDVWRKAEEMGAKWAKFT